MIPLAKQLGREAGAPQATLRWTTPGERTATFDDMGYRAARDGWIMQLHLYLDDPFPSTISRPVFRN